MSRQRGWVSVSVQTYQSHRTSAQRITNREYTVDETGATLAANSRDAPPGTHETIMSAPSWRGRRRILDATTALAT